MVEQLKKYFKLLFMSGNRDIVLQTFGEGACAGDKNLVRVVVNPNAKQLLETLQFAQSRGAGVFMQVNGGAGRGARHITTPRAVFLDLDGSPLSIVTTAVKQGFPKPHMVVQSSLGRWHIYWLLDGITLQNFSYLQKALAARFDGDPVVHNLDRVMRLPGTTNFKHGRDETKIIHYKPTAPVIDAGDFIAALQEVETETDERLVLQHVAQVGLEDALVVQGHDQERVEDVEALLPGNRTQTIVRIAGKLVDKYPDWSATEIKKELVAIVTSKTPDNAERVAAQAWKTEIFPAVDRFVGRRQKIVEEVRTETQRVNQAYSNAFDAYAQAGDTAVLDKKGFADRYLFVAADQLVYDLEKSPAQKPMTLAGFKNYAKIHGGLADNWLKNRGLRRTVDTLMYKPYPHTTDPNKLRMQRICRNEDTGELCHNVYSVPKIKPMVARDELAEQRAIKPFLDHMKYLFKAADKRNAFIDWIAATLQQPQRRVQWAPFIISKHYGVGKGWIANLLKKLVGVSNYQMIGLDQIDKGNYNDYMAHSTLVVLDEVYAPGRNDVVVKLQPLVTETAMDINVKYGAKGLQHVYPNLLLYSNYEDALKIYTGDRRFFVHIFDEPPLSKEYYTRLFDYLDSTDVSVLFNWLLNRDISKFSWGRMPDVRDKDQERLILAGRNEVEVLLDSLLEDREGPFVSGITTKRAILMHLNRHYEVDTAAHFIKLDHQLKAWLRSTGTTVGKLNGLGSFRHDTWYCVDKALTNGPDGLMRRVAATKMVKEVYGETSLQYRQIDKNLRDLERQSK